MEEQRPALLATLLLLCPWVVFLEDELLGVCSSSFWSFSLRRKASDRLRVGKQIPRQCCRLFDHSSTLWSQRLLKQAWIQFFQNYNMLKGMNGVRVDVPTLWSPADSIHINTKTIGNRKRDCAWGCACARGINTTWENLQIEKHKSVRWAEPTPT